MLPAMPRPVTRPIRAQISWIAAMKEEWKKPDYAKKREFGSKPGFEKKPYQGKKTHYDHKPPTDSAPRRDDSKPAFTKRDDGKPHFSKGNTFAKHKGPKKNKKPKHRPNPMITDTP